MELFILFREWKMFANYSDPLWRNSMGKVWRKFRKTRMRDKICKFITCGRNFVNSLWVEDIALEIYSHSNHIMLFFFPLRLFMLSSLKLTHKLIPQNFFLFDLNRMILIFEYDKFPFNLRKIFNNFIINTVSIKSILFTHKTI